MKTDAVDLEAITELFLAGQGTPVIAAEQVIGELSARSAHRLRRVQPRRATKNQLLGQLDRSFPGLTLSRPTLVPSTSGNANPSLRAGMGHRASRQLRRRGQQPAPVARTAAALPRLGPLADAVRVSRQTPRRRDQPRRPASSCTAR